MKEISIIKSDFFKKGEKTKVDDNLAALMVEKKEAKLVEAKPEIKKEEDI